MNSFHKNLNRMAFFTAFLLCALIIFNHQFLTIASANIYLNGAIIGTTLFGIILCFIKVFRLLPEHRWLNSYTRRTRRDDAQPRLLNSVAMLLRGRSQKLDGAALRSIMDTIFIRFEDDRESVRYITNTLIFLGLLGTFWGLIVTIGGFAELIGSLDFNDDTVLTSMQQGLAHPLGGMSTAFTSSLLGLGGSLVIGFLGLQLQLAQGAIATELEDYLSKNATISNAELTKNTLPKLQENSERITEILNKIEQRLKEISK